VEKPDSPAAPPRPNTEQDHRARSGAVKNRGGGSRLTRRADGAVGSDLFFVSEPRRTTNAVRAARRDLGLRVGGGQLTETEKPADRWQRRLGLQLWDLR